MLSMFFLLGLNVIGVYFVTPFEEAKHGSLACRASTTFAVPVPTKIAFINLNLARKFGFVFRCKAN